MIRINEFLYNFHIDHIDLNIILNQQDRKKINFIFITNK